MSENGVRRATIRDVAQAAGVSVATASNALNGQGRTNAETRERVKRVAEEIGFRPNALARGLLSRRSHSIGIITNDTYGRLTLPMTAGVSEALVDHGVSVFLCATNNDPRLARLHLEALLDKQVDGIIFTATRVDLPPPVDLTHLPIPVVYAFAEGPDTRVSFVPDDAQGARLAVEHLLSLGHGRILHITGPEDFAAVRRRAEAYRACLGSEGEVMFGSWGEDWGHEAVRQMLARDEPRPEAIFCGSDETARGVIDALRDHGLSVPGDIAVVGFDNWHVVAAQTRPALTTIDMGLKELGRRAGLAILDLTRGKSVPLGIEAIGCSLVVRKSCGAA
ncbi:LacI family transcriptional regulator [Rhizobium sp. Leaf384]|uniref:LacI family DNA-binding transcriptional regulator n=1 Tax=unclassified Rhizobium TaxID=2613769 RepID=UPI0007157738|nr:MULTISPECIES: LacI family DNA-binding transcriptional regulator [unclassified Rhizobium]KQS78894.1 LacI family transcriptional regulator [Rhizobium sp. Leaf384]KQS85470.1 LacI family transcriptional regulator [Rhizobium sp. Leaf383]